MYEKLIKSLRACAESSTTRVCPTCPWSFHQKGCITAMVTAAADAIEERCQQVDIFMQEAARLYAKLPRWIPVAERLPNGEAERYLVAASLMSHGLWVSICYYADNLEEVDEYDFKDEKHSGFYGYDDEYGYYEKSGVKYWMPLPAPPKEEV